MVSTEYFVDDLILGPEYTIGNPNLPIAKYRDEIVDKICKNMVTVLTSGTGTGKSTQVPQFLLDNFDRVFITQPRIVAAREIKHFISSQIADNSGDRDHNLVGYETAPEADLHPDNKIIVITDGLQIMREINGQGIRPGDILILDEFHERNVNMDVLLAIALEKNIRIVIMSATLDANLIAEHCQSVTQQDVPVIGVPGVTHEVEESFSSSGDDVILDAAKDGKNILVFVPGRREIEAISARIRRRAPKGYAILALHGDQTPDEQSKVFMSYPGGKIIFSTAVGQTSITINDIDVVVDCGFERRMILDEYGKQTLAVESSSRAVMDQRRGRVGRTKPGEYVLSQFKELPPLPDNSEREAYDTPEIMRSRADDLLVRLAMGKFALGTMPLLDKPSEKEVSRSIERLSRTDLISKLGVQAVDSYMLTERGESVANMSINSNYAAIVERSRKYGPRVELQAMAAVSVQQLSGIVNTTKGMENWRRISSETESDMLANIEFMIAAAKGDERSRADSHLRELRFRKAWRNFDQLAKRRNLDPYDLVEPDNDDRTALMNSVMESFDEIYIRSGSRYKDVHGNYRRLAKSTTIVGTPDFVLGSSFNLDQPTKKGITRHKLIVGATAVDIDSIATTNPDRIGTEHKSYKVDEYGVVVEKVNLTIDGFDLRRTVERRADPSVALHSYLVGEAFNGSSLDDMPKKIRSARIMIDRFKDIQLRTDEDLGIEFSLRMVIDKTIDSLKQDISSLAELDNYINLDEIGDILPSDIIDEITESSPDNVTFSHSGNIHTLGLSYAKDEPRALLVAPRHFHKSLPLVVGDRRIKVATHKNGEYINLEDARNIEAPPSRSVRRGNEKTEQVNTGAQPVVKNRLSKKSLVKKSHNTRRS